VRKPTSSMKVVETPQNVRETAFTIEVNVDKKRSYLELAFEEALKESCPEIPAPEIQRKPLKGRRYSCDFIWRDRKIIVEVDGGTKLPGGGSHGTDRECRNIYAWLGYTTAFFDDDMINKFMPYCMDVMRALFFGIESLESIPNLLPYKKVLLDAKAARKAARIAKGYKAPSAPRKPRVGRRAK